ncbi:MAG: N-formylglutamate amidohydrolase [Candidatus Peribacteraceae bacterium]|nr:N-formylglutamate amidohydrolase [Candidatus Peribacteria bacterium]
MNAESSCRPILVSIPHAGSQVPEEVTDDLLLSQEELLQYTDLYTDKIFNVEDAYLVTNPISRVIVDVNRAPDDISREYEQAAEGVIVHTTWDGKSVYKREPTQSTADALIKKYHDPYHQKIDDHMAKVQFLIDGHSYLPIGPKLKRDNGEPRPDINVGNMNFSTCTREQTVFFREFFEARGYSVRINFPYAGKYILGHHCHRRRIPPFLVPGVQIEINQGLYVKEDSFEPIPDRVEEFHMLFSKLVSAFAEKFVK